MADAFDEAANAVYNQGGFNASDMTTDAARKLLTATANTIKQGVDSHLPVDVPPTLRYALENNAFIFSGLKTFHALREVGLSMVKDDGSIKSFEEFKDDVKQINSKYNTNYLYAEYKHAVGTSQMAAKWVDIEADGDRYDLQYRTAGDDKVRPDHAALNGITLAPSDPFWSKYYPPNGWGCRCTAVQVRVGKYQRSNPADAMQAGDTATEEAKQKMFRYNSGKTMQLFPPKHPYYKAPVGAKAVVQQVAAQQHQQQRAADMLAELPANLTDAEKQAIVQHCQKLEKSFGITKGKRMTVDQADKQAANPNYGKNRYYGINCQTCSAAYALRLLGFDLWAKPNTPNSKLEYLSRGGHNWEKWLNIDGTPAKHTELRAWAIAKGYTRVTPARYLEFFNEVCKETGIYELSIGWRGRGGHSTILQRFEDGTLRYIEPQHDNSAGSGREKTYDINYLANHGACALHNIHECRGIMRIDNKLFNDAFAEIFDH